MIFSTFLRVVGMTRQVLRLAVLLALAAVVGCGGGHKVEGEVTLDGKAVEGAIVTFVPADGTGEQAFGATDAGGKFTLRTANQKSVPAGNYKVIVVKGEKSQAFQKEGQKLSGDDYVKAMKGGGGKGGMMMPSAPKSLLPEKYATPAKSPLTATVPTSGLVKLELSSK